MTLFVVLKIGECLLSSWEMVCLVLRFVDLVLLWWKKKPSLIPKYLTFNDLIPFSNKNKFLIFSKLIVLQWLKEENVFYKATMNLTHFTLKTFWNGQMPSLVLSWLLSRRKSVRVTYTFQAIPHFRQCCELHILSFLCSVIYEMCKPTCICTLEGSNILKSYT